MLDKKLKAPRALKEDMERSIATNRAGSRLDKPEPALDLKKWRDKPSGSAMPCRETLFEAKFARSVQNNFISAR